MSSPYINHFLQPDTLIPDPSNPHAWNRYSYTLNNPIRYNDPSGHKVCEGDADSFDTCNAYGSVDDELLHFGIKTKGLNKKEKKDALFAAQLAGGVLGQIVFGDSKSPEEAFRLLHGNIMIAADANRNNCETVTSNISCGAAALNMIAFLHEFGHVFDNHAGGLASDMLGLVSSPDNENGGWERSPVGFKCGTSDCLAHPPSMGYYDSANIHHNNQSSAEARDEQWADLYLNAIYNDANHGFTPNAAGNQRAWEFFSVVMRINGR